MKNSVFIVGIIFIAIGAIMGLTMFQLFSFGISSGSSFILLGIVIIVVGAIWGGDVSYKKVNVLDATNMHKICPKCKRAITSDAKFCPYCTHKF